MKEIQKDVYHEAKYGRGTLLTISIILLLLALGALVGGIILLVSGIKAVAIASMILKIIFGALLILGGIGLGAFALVMLFTSLSMIKNKYGSVKDGNRAFGTVNVVKCDKCGEELPDNADFCSKCGTQVNGVKKCACGTENKMDAEYCTKCGEKLTQDEN